MPLKRAGEVTETEEVRTGRAGDFVAAHTRGEGQRMN